MNADEILPRIKPRNIKESDKYSSNFYKFIRETRMTDIVLHKPTGDLFVCYAGWEYDSWGVIIGARIRNILCGIRTTSSDGYTAVHLGKFLKESENVTERFWRDYIRDGRCVFDRDHDRYMQGDGCRFTVVNGTRRCNWCGKWFKSRVVKRVRVTREVVWEPVERIKA